MHRLGTSDATDWDQCAHGTLRCTVGNIAVEENDCNVTAASLFLLRTLDHDHTPSDPVAPSSQLIPHCGQTPWALPDGRFPTINTGCDIGVDIWVRHRSECVALTYGDWEETVSEPAWRATVVAFADQVRAFYDVSPPRRRSLGGVLENEGWDAFWTEWLTRRNHASPGRPAATAPPVVVE